MINVPELHDQHFALRHGKSIANEKGVIASGLRGLFWYGLTDEGKQQVRESVLAAKEQGILDEKTIIESSPMKRARQTARIAAEVLGIPRRQIRIRFGLRERYFGQYEGGSQKHYKNSVWPVDPIFMYKRLDKVESTDHVRRRGVKAVLRNERKYVGRNIVYVGHGDTHQILQTAFEGIPSGDHRSVKNMGYAELRNLNSVASSANLRQ